MPTYAAYVVATIPMGFASLTMLTAANATLQTTTHPALRGRVMALYMMVFQGVTPIGAPLIGWIGERFGPRYSLATSTIAVGVVCLLASLLAARRWDVHVRAKRTWPLLEIIHFSDEHPAARIDEVTVSDAVEAQQIADFNLTTQGSYEQVEQIRPDVD
jgi:MFS family permease